MRHLLLSGDYLGWSFSSQATFTYYSVELVSQNILFLMQYDIKERVATRAFAIWILLVLERRQ